jgi:hypothetical protein
MMKVSCFVTSLGEVHEQRDHLLMMLEIGSLSKEGNLLAD